MEYVYREPHWPYSRWYYVPLAAQLPGVSVELPAPKNYELNNVEPEVSAEVPIRVKRPFQHTRYLFYPDIHRTIFHPIMVRHIIEEWTESVNVLVDMPASNYNINALIPTVGQPTPVNIIIPTIASYTATGLVPAVGVSTNILAPLSQYQMTAQVPLVGTGVLINVPLSSYDLIALIPVIIAGVGVSILMPEKSYTGLASIPTIHSTGIPTNPEELDLTPPFEEVDQTRYLFHNFELLRRTLDEGATSQFTTTDGKTVLVRNGVIVDVY